MHKPLFRIAVGSVAAVGGLLVASAMPAGAATAILAANVAQDPPVTCTVPNGSDLNTACTGADDTPVTFSITSSGVLAITAPSGAPDAVDLGTIVSGASAGTIGAPGNFGPVTVTDNRALDPANWTATVYSTAFANTTTKLSVDTIPAADATYTIPAEGTDTTGAIAAVTGLPLPTSSGTGAPLVDDAVSGIALPDPTLVSTPPPAAVVTVSGYDGDSGATWSPEIDIAIPINAVAGVYTGTVTHSVA